MPVSYGWVDHGSARIVFRRGYLGNDALGRPGNFWAHMLAGPRAALPADELTYRFASPFWWTGEDAGKYAAGELTLQPVELANVPPGALVDTDVGLLQSLTEALLSPRPRLPLVLRCPPDQTAALMTALAGRLPGFLEAMPFSTYEPPGMASRFHVVGTTGQGIPPNATIVPGGASPGRAESVRRARELILSATPGDRSLVVMCVSASDERGGSANIARLGVLINLFDRLRVGAHIEKSVIAAALRRPLAARHLLEIPAAIEVISTDLASSQSTFWDCLQESASGIPAEDLAALGAAVGHKAAGHGSPTILSQVIIAADKLPVKFAASCALAALNEAGDIPGLLGRLTAGTILSMTRHAAASGLSSAEDRISALLAAPAAYPAVVDARDVPSSWRGVVLAHSLDRVPSLASRIADRINSEPDLTGPLAGALRSHNQLVAVLSRVQPGQLPSRVLEAGRHLPVTSRVDLAVWCAGRLPPQRQLGFLTEYAHLIPTRESTPSWRDLVGRAVQACTVYALQQADANPVPSRAALDLLAQADVESAASWNKLVVHLSADQRRGSADVVDRWIGRGLDIIEHVTDPTQQGVLVDLLLFVGLRRQISWSSFKRLAARLEECFPGKAEDAAACLLRACDYTTSRDQGVVSSVHCLVYVAQLVDRRDLPTTITGHLRNKTLNGLAVKVIRSLPDTALVEVADSISQSCRTRTPIVWWASLNRSLLQYLPMWRR